MTKTQTGAYSLWEEVEELNRKYDSYIASRDIGRTIGIKLMDNPEWKDEIYNLTLEWVNKIRSEQMVGQEPLESLLPGNEMQSDSCVIAMSLDEVYDTSIGDFLLRNTLVGTIDSDLYESLPKSKDITWYAEWINKNDRDDWGYEQLPWFAFLLAKGFDYGAFPELIINK